MSEIKDLIDGLLAGPDDPSAEFIPGGLTRGEIYGLAAGFLGSGMNEHEPVCVCTEDRGLVAAAILASLAGGAICVLPYALSPRAISETGEATGFRRAIIDRPIDLPDGVRGIIPVQDVWKPVSARDPESVFLKLFTGGSTDRPRTWSKTPASMIGEAHYQAMKYGITGNDLFAATVPPYHIYGLLFTVLIPFLASAAVVEGVHLFPGEIAAALRNDPVSVLVSVPVHYRALNGTRIIDHGLRLAFSSAGPLDVKDADAFYRETGICVEEIYGSTETGGVACKSSAAGRELLEPFGPVRWKIDGGLLSVKSPFISRDLPVDREGFFITGDMADKVGDDRFLILGRADSVVKVGGKRVDLAEVRERIRRIAGVRDAFVFSLADRAGRGSAIAAIVESDFDETRLREMLAGELEPYAVPRRIRVVKRMPSTSSGKYDRDAIVRYFNDKSD
ncbi:MAG: long-chain fatty acid--CoA ligase [Chrysiogenales bacterium]|nr:MAG: long-chain fatty acid--CoA ligase [Chrysiogenales bacterium]